MANMSTVQMQRTLKKFDTQNKKARERRIAEREAARNSKDERLHRALRFAELGYGVAAVMSLAGCDSRTANLLVLGREV